MKIFKKRFGRSLERAILPIPSAKWTWQPVIRTTTKYGPYLDEPDYIKLCQRNDSFKMILYTHLLTMVPND